jgi:hypothetical protein
MREHAAPRAKWPRISALACCGIARRAVLDSGTWPQEVVWQAALRTRHADGSVVDETLATCAHPNENLELFNAAVDVELLGSPNTWTWSFFANLMLASVMWESS